MKSVAYLARLMRRAATRTRRSYRTSNSCHRRWKVAWRMGIEPYSHVAARNIEADAADRDVVLVGDYTAAQSFTRTITMGKSSRTTVSSSLFVMRKPPSKDH